MLRRFASTLLPIALLSGLAGCFALFSLDEYNEGEAVVDASPPPADGGAPTEASSSDVKNPNENKVSLDAGQILFVTKATFNGNLEGLSGANARCQEIAAAAELPGTYVALLGVPDSPVERFVDDNAQVGRPLIDPTGRILAATWTDLFEKGANIQFDRDERGGQINFTQDGGVPACEVNPAVAWTGAEDPNRGGQHCNQWRNENEGAEGTVGFGVNRTKWVSTCVIKCSQAAHLYCAQSFRE